MTRGLYGPSISSGADDAVVKIVGARTQPEVQTKG